MRSPEEIEKKYEQLNEILGEHLSSFEIVKKLNKIEEDKIAENGEEAKELALKLMGMSAHTISLDAQRYILEWVMGQHD